MPTVEDYLGLLMDEMLQVGSGARREIQPEPATSEAPAAPGEAHPAHTGPAPARPSTSGRKRPPDTKGVTPAEVAALNGQIQQQFGVGTAGQWRSPANDAQRRKRTGRKGVSDHVSGLAIDITGDEAKLDRVAAWAQQQPNVKYVLWRTKDHYDHVHISFWGAQ